MASFSPDVSVVIPTYNRRAYLEQAIRSCFTGNETLDVEVIVVDDGSTDGTRAFLRSLEGDERMRPIFQEHQGAQAARNRGMSEARGAFVKFLDDDDWLADGAMHSEVDTLRRSGASLCYGSCCALEEDGRMRTFSMHPPSFRPDDLVTALLEESIIYRPFRFMYRRELALGHKWNTRLPWCQDYSYILSIAAEEPDHVSSGAVAGYVRQHQGERISRSADIDTKLSIQFDLLEETVEKLISAGRLTASRRAAGVRKAWKLAHMMSARDMRAFRRAFLLVERLDSNYTPQRASVVLSILDHILGVQGTEYATHPLRRLKMALFS